MNNNLKVLQEMKRELLNVRKNILKNAPSVKKSIEQNPMVRREYLNEAQKNIFTIFEETCGKAEIEEMQKEELRKISLKTFEEFENLID